MRMYDIIMKKRRGEALTDGELKFFVDGFTAGKIPDYQAAAFCMAVCFCGMTEDECASLTRHMMLSGDVMDLSSLPYTADKHSTGGVGDKTSLIIAPVAASLGLSVAKMSGRGLGHTGGTVDKLESIPGFKTSLTEEEFISQVKKIGVALIGQTGNLAPADKKLYALRDVTATVDSIPLIASSVMSKKLAAGAENIVLDVKYGSGAFMKTPEDAEKLAETMVKIGKANSRRVSALITDMDKPLGYAVGNSLEVMEAFRVLRGEEKGELYDICAALAGEMLALAKNLPHDEAVCAVKDSIDSGKAYEKMLEWISAQGGDFGCVIENRLPVGKCSRTVFAEADGYVSHINAEGIGISACVLGAGRINKSDTPDLSAGILMKKNTGDRVLAGDELAVLYSSDEEKLDSGEVKFRESVVISNERPIEIPLIYKIIR